MELKKLEEKVRETQEYKNYSKEINSYLTHASKIEEKDKSSEWEFGYYEPETDKITVFETNPVKKRQADETLKKEDKVVESLDLKEVEVDYNEALSVADDYAKEKKETLITKKITILQKLNGKTVWNLTYLTSSFKLLNMKIDANTKKIINSNLYSIYDMGLKNL